MNNHSINKAISIGILLLIGYAIAMYGMDIITKKKRSIDVSPTVAATSSAIAISDMDKLISSYFKGEYEFAFKAFKPKADDGDPTSQFYLGIMHYHGQFVPQNYINAYMWLTLAKKNGYQDKSNMLDESLKLTADKLTSDEIKKAEALVKDWQVKHTKK